MRERNTAPEQKAKRQEIDARRRKNPAVVAGHRRATREWYARNAEEQRAIARKKQKENLDRVYAAKHRRNARLRDGESVGVSAAQWREMCDVFGGRCAYCLQKTPLTRDHVVAVAIGGRDEPGNVVLACRPCNTRKNASTLLAFVARGGGVVS